MKLQYSIFILATALAAPLSASAADVDALMKDCNGCHGDNGVSKWADVPTIGGLAEFVHSDALYFFRDGERPCSKSKYRQGDTSRPETDMCAVAKKLSDEQIDALAAAYAALPYVRAKQDFDAALAAKGKAIHEERCGRCHSDGGTNVDDEAGMLGGQSMGYLEEQLGHYRAGEREQPKKMEENIAELSDDDVKALVNYYGSEQ